MIKYHHSPLARVLGYTKGGCKKGAAARITVHLQFHNFWAKKPNILTWVLCIFAGWRIIYHFRQRYPNTFINKVQTDELWLVILWQLKVSLIPGVHRPSLPLQQNSPTEAHLHACFACSASERHLSSSCLCPQLCDNKKWSTVGQALLSLFPAATKKVLPAAQQHPSGLICKHSQRCLAVPSYFSLLVHFKWIKKAITNTSLVSRFANELSAGI